ncbi:hypothetical protein [Actinoalloteichus sp. AHMU CJ021]
MRRRAPLLAVVPLLLTVAAALRISPFSATAGCALPPTAAGPWFG